MKVLSRKLLIPLVVLCLFGLEAIGQSASAIAPSTGKIVEVNFGENRPVSKIPLSESRPAGFWTSNIPRLSNWQQIQDGDPVQAVNIAASLTGDGAEVRVSVFKGKRFGEIDETVGVYTLAEGKSVRIDAIKRYGFEPFSLMLIMVDPIMGNLPVVENPSRTLWVSVSPVESSLPSYSVKFRNDSGKSVLAIAFHSEADGRPMYSAIPQGQYGKPLLEPREEYDATMRTNGRVGIKVVVEAVVYDDKTIEGDKESGAKFLAYLRGRSAALHKVIPMIRSEAKVDSRPDLLALVNRIDAEAVAPARTAGSASAMALSESVAFEIVVRDVIGALRKLDASATAMSSTELHRALTEFAQFNQEWLDRIGK